MWPPILDRTSFEPLLSLYRGDLAIIAAGIGVRGALVSYDWSGAGVKVRPPVRDDAASRAVAEPITIKQPFQDGTVRIPCDVCAWRDGFAYYGLVGADMALDRAGRFRVGAAGRVYRGYTSGDALGAAPPRETTDRWVNVMGTFTVSF